MRPLPVCLFRFIFVLMLVPGAAQADALRCGDRLVHVDDSAGEVLATCGEPAHREQHYTRWRDVVYESDETWTYNFGPQRLLQQLRFRNGRLLEIDAAGYGYADYAAD